MTSLSRWLSKKEAIQIWKIIPTKKLTNFDQSTTLGSPSGSPLFSYSWNFHRFVACSRNFNINLWVLFYWILKKGTFFQCPIPVSCSFSTRRVNYEHQSRPPQKGCSEMLDEHREQLHSWTPSRGCTYVRPFKTQPQNLSYKKQGQKSVSFSLCLRYFFQLPIIPTRSLIKEALTEVEWKGDLAHWSFSQLERRTQQIQTFDSKSSEEEAEARKAWQT